MEYKTNDGLSFTIDDVYFAYITQSGSTYIFLINIKDIYDISEEVFNDIIQHDNISLLNTSDLLDEDADYDYYNINCISELHGKTKDGYSYTITNTTNTELIYVGYRGYKKIVDAFYKNRQFKIDELIKN